MRLCSCRCIPTLCGFDASHLATLASNLSVESRATLSLDSLAALLANRLIEIVAVARLNSLATFLARFACKCRFRCEPTLLIMIV
jgi:hypothetical protein